MSDVLVRDVPEQVLRALEVQAAAAGMSRQEWLRARLIEVSTLPLVKARYRFHAYSAMGMLADIERAEDGTVNHHEYGLTEEATESVRKACLLIIHNHPGDRENALAELKRAFGAVTEVPVEP